jgi:hypothetical protein
MCLSETKPFYHVNLKIFLMNPVKGFFFLFSFTPTPQFLPLGLCPIYKDGIYLLLIKKR